MSQHTPTNVYDTTVPSPYERPSIVTSMGGANWHETARNCKSDSKKITKQRKKASRACDQCRKKRIKCEYNQHTRVCQGCLEVGEFCLFVRVPLKRGPTKKRTPGTTSDKMSSENSLFNYRPRTHSYPVLESIHLPSLSQNFSFPTINSLCVSPMPAQSQPFWKVPYDDVQRRSSLGIFPCDSTSSIGTQENYNSDQDSTVKQRGRNNAEKGIITPVEDKSEDSSTARSQHLHLPQFQEQRAKPFFNNCTSGNPRTNSISCPSDGALSERTSHGNEQYMLTPNSVHSTEKDRSSSLTIRSLGSKFDIDDNIPKWQNNSAWAPAYMLSDTNRPSCEKKVHSNNNNTNLESAVFSSSNGSAERQFSEITFLKLIGIYYDFFHINLPIVPINKSKLISLFVSINQPINHEVMAINNEVILCFKDALEILVFSTMKQRKSSTSWPQENACDFQKGVYYAQNFRKCINECFQGTMIIKSKLKRISAIIPSRVKFIYLSTIVILNYILVLTGDENSSLLGPSVGVFNEFQSHKLFLPLKDVTSMPLLNSDQKTNNEQLDYAILFQRLYILLSILDSIQSFRLGQPKLINLKFDNPIDMYFRDTTSHDHLVEQNPTILDNILQNLKLGGFMADFVFNRKSLQMNSFQNLLTTAEVVWENTTGKNDEPDNITGKFQTLLIEKENLIKRLLNMEQKDQPLDNCCDSNVKTDAVAEIVCSMINLISGILVSVINTNPENLIDYTLKVVPNTHSAPNKVEEPMSPKQSNIHSLCNTKTRHYVNESIPSTNDAGNGYATRKWKKGTVSVFILPIVEECSNIVRLVGSIPSTLINLYIRSGNMPTETNAKIMMLSTALSELVHITGLFSKLGPNERKISVTNKHVNGDIACSNKDLSSVMKYLYLEMHAAKNVMDVVPPEDESTKILGDFSNIGWKLMDDSELGCCHSLTN